MLKLHGVKSYKHQGLEIEFHAEQPHQKGNPELPPPDDKSTELITDTLKQQEMSLPPDLRADVLLDQNKIMNWSSPDQDPDQKEIPLTGEQPL